jgi:hypothetical protein
MNPDKSRHQVLFGPYPQYVCDFCRYIARRETLRRAAFVVYDSHGTQAGVCAQHLGPFLEAVAKDRFTVHDPNACAVCEEERQQRESLLAEKRQKREAKRNQPSALTGETE